MIETLERPAANLQDNAADRRPLNWRQIAAAQLLAEAHEELPSHDDPWINDLAQLCYLGRRKDKSLVLTARHRSIRDAVLLKESGSLAAEVLEARLLAGLPPAWIAQHSSVRPDVIEAYTALYFDVSLPNSTQRWFQTGLFANLKPGNRTIWELGTYLKRTGIMLVAAVMEHAIRQLASLEGPTLADGLAEPIAVADVLARGCIAACLIRSPRRAQRLQTCLSQFREDYDSAVSADALIELLREVKITRTLQRQLQQLRQPQAGAR